MNKIILLTSLSILASCHSNPYPNGTNFSDKKDVVRPMAQAAFGIDLVPIMDFSEGATAQYKFAVNVPAGNPIVSWAGFPKGAKYDVATGIIEWTPGYTDANDPKDMSVKTKEYLATMTLRSDVDPLTAITKTVIFKVNDTPRTFSLKGVQNTVSINEGEEKELTRFTVETLDFPNGPFNVSLKAGHAGLRLVQSDKPGEWILMGGVFGNGSIKAGTPNCSSYDCNLSWDDSLVAYAPDGRMAESKISFKVADQRKVVGLSLGSKIDVRGDVSLGFSAIDPNEEVAPEVTIQDPPTVGHMEIVPVTEVTASAFETRYVLVWNHIPQEAIGKSFSVNLKACNSEAGTAVNHNACQTVAYQLNVSAQDVILPTLTRGSWDISELKYLQAEKEFIHPLSISAGNGAQIISMKAVSSDTHDTITPNADNSALSIVPHAPGIKFATVTVRNSLGGVASEIFMYEVLPSNWSSNLVLGLGGVNAELSTLESYLTSVNREFPGVSGHTARSLTGRNSVYVSTHALSLPGGANEVDYFAGKLNNVIVSTPNLTALPASLVNELRSHGVYLAGKAADTAGFSLKDFQLNPARTFGLPSGVSGLAGTTTAESANPALLSVSMSSDCTRIFSLFKPGATPLELLTGVSCTRANGGRIVVLGFEMADIRVSQADTQLPAQWFKKMME